jgi:hypothetical protein
MQAADQTGYKFLRVLKRMDATPGRRWVTAREVRDELGDPWLERSVARRLQRWTRGVVARQTIKRSEAFPCMRLVVSEPATAYQLTERGLQLLIERDGPDIVLRTIEIPGGPYRPGKGKTP